MEMVLTFFDGFVIMLSAKFDYKNSELVVWQIPV